MSFVWEDEHKLNTVIKPCEGMEMLRGSEGEEEEEEEWEEAEEGVEVEEVEEDEEEEEELSRELQQLAEMELGETEQVFNSPAAAIFTGD